jgi:hypothetical protein
VTDETPKILDSYGKPIEKDEPKPEPHKFGQFSIPKDCHVKGVTGFTPGNWSNRR